MPITRSQNKTRKKDSKTPSEVAEKDQCAPGEKNDKVVGKQGDKREVEAASSGDIVEGEKQCDHPEEVADLDLAIPPSMAQVECSAGIFDAVASVMLNEKMVKTLVCNKGHTVYKGKHYEMEALSPTTQESDKKSTSPHGDYETQPILQIRDLRILANIGLENEDEEQCIMSVKHIPKYSHPVTSSNVRNKKISIIPAGQLEPDARQTHDQREEEISIPKSSKYSGGDDSDMGDISDTSGTDTRLVYYSCKDFHWS